MIALNRVLFKHVSRSRVKLAIARPVYATLHLFLRSDRRRITRAGIHYEVDISEGLDLSLFLFGFVQKHVTEPKYFRLPDDAVVLDVGANAGVTALAYARCCRNGRVYAFEPTHSSFARLRKNLALNPELARRITPVQLFVSDRSTSAPGITAYASWDLRSVPAGKRHPVHCGVVGETGGIGAVTLDEFCRERDIDRVDFIKIDTDGHEMAVLNGAAGILKTCRPMVLFEVGLYGLEEHGIPFGSICDFFSRYRYELINAENGMAVLRSNYDRVIPARATTDILARPLPQAADGEKRSGGSSRPSQGRVARRKRVVVIGGGIAGLVAARTLAKNCEAEIVLIEREQRLGGLAGSFEIEGGVEIEKYYHFICKPDTTYMRLMQELDILDRLHWRTTEMGFYHDGVLSTFGDPVSLLRLEWLGWLDKMRFAMVSRNIKRARSDGWRLLEDRAASDWLIEQYGRRIYDLLYEPLMRLKFRDHVTDISAAWVWARHHRISRSRTLTQKERIGYLEGGTQLFINGLEADLRRRGVEIRVGTAVDGLEFENGRVARVRLGNEMVRCDHLIATIPTAYLLPLIESLHGPYWENLRSLESIGVVVILLRLDRKLSKYFWMNVSDPRIDLAGLIEYTNLNPCPKLGGDSLLYLPQYAASTHPLYQASNDELMESHLGYLKLINPAFDESWVKQWWIHRDRYSQPICRTGFAGRLPAMQTAVENMYVTDSHQLHPHDRAISASSDLGEQVSTLVLARLRAHAA